MVISVFIRCMLNDNNILSGLWSKKKKRDCS